jgi:heptaprenyl diphosphate synthase/octaprenyl-diphosphate synthase
VDTNEIRRLVKDELDAVINNIRNLETDTPSSISGLISHSNNALGKLLRPTITLLASKACSEADSSLPIKMATGIELLHIATLIHDDTVDKSEKRRGQATLNAIWGDHAAVLLGDYLFAQSAIQVCDTKNIYVIRRFSETIMELSKGELDELLNAYDIKQQRSQYFERIYNKTATLFSTAAECGGILGGMPDNLAKCVKIYGLKVGMAFQIIDDILDFQSEESKEGKPIGRDLLNGTLTLPSILLLECQPDNTTIPNVLANVNAEKNLKETIKAMDDLDIIEKTLSIASNYVTEASEAISPLPESQYKEALLHISSSILK